MVNRYTTFVRNHRFLFTELWQSSTRRSIEIRYAQPSRFDPPYALERHDGLENVAIIYPWSSAPE